MDEAVTLKDTTNFQEGCFSYSEIHNYVAKRCYPEGFSKEDKLGLRKRSKYVAVRQENLYYVRGKSIFMQCKDRVYLWIVHVGKGDENRLVVEDPAKRSSSRAG